MKSRRKTGIRDGKKPTAIDLFAGCGGLTEGLKRGGFKVIGAVEIGDVELLTYGQNHPDVKNVWSDDIRNLDSDKITSFFGVEPGEIDLLAGCPPCQGFSTLRTNRKKAEVQDPRNDLVEEFARFVEALKPKVVMMENVPGLAKHRRTRELLERLEALEYYAKPDCVSVLNAANFGVPQRRNRMVLLTTREGRLKPASEAKKRKTVRDAIEDLPPAGASGDQAHDIGERRSKKIQKLIRKIPKDGGSRTDLSEEEQLDCHKRCDGFTDVYGRMAWDDVAPTITGGCVNPSKGRFLHPNENRCITPREAALLQGFRPDYFFSFERGKFSAAQMIGNALPPPFVEAHVAVILDHLQGEH